MKYLLITLVFAVIIQGLSLIRVSDTFIVNIGGSTAHCPQDNSLVDCPPIGGEDIRTTERGFPGFYNGVVGLYTVKTAAAFMFWSTISAITVTVFVHISKQLRKQAR